MNKVANSAAMTGPIIPAGEWPEGADRHCWDANGLGFFYGPPTEKAQMWLLVLKQSHIPLPAGWDWRVPVMRPSEEARAIDLEQPQNKTFPADVAAAVGDMRRLLAMIDGQARLGIDLAADHTGMRVDYSGLIEGARRGLAGDPGIAEMLRQLCSHLGELGRRWYAGDRKVVDEFLQLYCIESEARAALVKQPTKGEGE